MVKFKYTVHSTNIIDNGKLFNGATDLAAKKENDNLLVIDPNY